ncbi:Eco57I restriction-modification methylase domain-containing protein [Haladaptatus paucihalophilus]|nr:N-6 DNA methylase [Haladaptatus paucihalophilus]SHL19508.1 N-6 DNA Methylase [Haladaptatus paucihalophilus DX253]
MTRHRGAAAGATESVDETVRRALELATDELLVTLEPTAAGPELAFDAALVGVFDRLVTEFAAARDRDRPPFAKGPELRDERVRFDSLSEDANERLHALLDSLAYDSLSFRRLGGAYERSLDYVPEMEDGGIRLTGDATRRVSAGAYYTPNEVVEYAVSRALHGREDARVIDPAMGSGNFLTCAIDRLAESRDEQSERARQFVAENRIFGVDVDPLAVELARSAVWFETGVWPDDTLVVGDALASNPEWMDVAGFDGDGFDAVVGNPPYVRSRHLPAERKDDLRERYDTVTGSFDLYVPFVERMAELGGRVSCIVPNKWTTARYGRPLRNRLLDEHRLVELLDVSNGTVFPDASVYPLVLTFDSGGGPTEEISIRRGESSDGTEETAETTLSRSFVDALGDRVIPVGIDPSFGSLAERLVREFDELGAHVDMTEGIHTGNVREKLVVDEPGPDCEKVVGGGDVSRYRLEWDGDWVRFDPSLIGDGEYGALRDRTVFDGEKLLLRDISDRPVATYDDAGTYALNTLFSVRSRPRSDLPLRYLLAVINATVSACWFQQVYGGTHVSGGYLRFKPMFANRLPIPDGEGERDELVALTERLERLREARADIEIRLPGGDGDEDEEDGSPEGDEGPEEDEGEGDDGPRLGDLVRRVGTDSPLAETTTTRDGLRVGNVSVERGVDELVFSATARYRPAEERATDTWGFAETEPIRALVFEADGREEWRDVLPWYVPRHVESDGFTEEARKTISPLDRLESIRLPSLETATAFAERCRSAAQVDAKIERTDAEIDRLVSRAYGLSADEIELVERLVN